jgi:hypothetical protein
LRIAHYYLKANIQIFGKMFHNVIAIVSGGASGLGAATASYLVRHGARVIVADLPAARENFLTLKESLLATMTTTTTTTSSREGGSGCGDGGGAASSAGSSECGGGGGGSIEFAAADVTSECEISSALDMAEEAFGDRGKHTLFVHPRTHPLSSPSVDPRAPAVARRLLVPVFLSSPLPHDHQSTFPSTAPDSRRRGRLSPAKSIPTDMRRTACTPSRSSRVR